MEKINVLEQIIKDRRTVKASRMTGETIPDEQIKRLLYLADQAPNHGKTEPWRFWIYSGESLKAFGQKHADLYWKYTPEEKRKQAKYDKLIRYASQSSHLIIAVMKRTAQSRIPRFEEMAAVSAAIEHILLGATAFGLASFWNTGGMAKHDCMKDFLSLKEEDKVMGFLYLGYSHQPQLERKNNIAIEEKINWNPS